MNEPSSLSEYLVLSRGQWDANASRDDIETAIQKFYDWYARNLEAGRMKAGSRLTIERAVVSKTGIVTDGPFGESKEVVGGYWFIVARNLRPLESARASVYNITNENPAS
jgi:hypothetical protein